MYEDRVHHPLSSRTPELPPELEAAMWRLYQAIGTYFELGDTPEAHRLRLRGFMANRISLDRDYKQHYERAAQHITALITQFGEQEAFKKLFTTRNPTPGSDREIAKKKVSDEFVEWRLALGGFSVFGASNYRGYIGGANLADEQTPYRTR